MIYVRMIYVHKDGIIIWDGLVSDVLHLNRTFSHKVQLGPEVWLQGTYWIELNYSYHLCREGIVFVIEEGVLN